MSNCWVEFLLFMYVREVGDTFTVRELREALIIWPKSTVSGDIYLAKKKKFLKSVARGTYEVVRKFPKYITLAEFYNIPIDNLEYLEYVLNKKEQRI